MSENPRVDSKGKGFLSSNLSVRLLSSLVLGPMVLGAIYMGGPVYDVLIIAVMALAMREWVALVGPKLSLQTKGTGLFCLLAVLAAGAWGAFPFGLCLAGMLALFLFVLSWRERSDVWFSLLMPYLGGAGLSLLALRADRESGRFLVFFVVLVVWATDIGGYLFGRTIGGPKLLPSISPKKTWAGLLGGMLLAAIVGGAAVWVAEGGLNKQHVVLAAILSMLMAVVAQAGDFFESFVKRRAGRKDSGDLIPGHGGILDRIDGLLFAAPFLALLRLGKAWLAL